MFLWQIASFERNMVTIQGLYSLSDKTSHPQISWSLEDARLDVIMIVSLWNLSRWGLWGFSKVVATFNHVGGSFNLFMATTGDVLIIPPFRILGYVLNVEHISCVITNCGQHQWAIPSLFSIALYVLLEENIPENYHPCLRVVLQKFAIQGYFPYIIFYCYILSLLSSGCFVLAECDSVSVLVRGLVE